MLTMTPSILQYSSVTHFKAAAHPGNGRMLTGGPEAAALNKTITTIKLLSSIVLKKKQQRRLTRSVAGTKLELDEEEIVVLDGQPSQLVGSVVLFVVVQQWLVECTGV